MSSKQQQLTDLRLTIRMMTLAREAKRQIGAWLESDQAELDRARADLARLAAEVQEASE